jgi:hypothetical protein
MTDHGPAARPELSAAAGADLPGAALVSDTMPIAAVVVGPRSRADNGTLLELAGSIRMVGLLHPVVVNGRGELVAGGRRLAACKELAGSAIRLRAAPWSSRSR